MKQIFILLFFACFLKNTFAQDTVKIFPGSREIEINRLKPHVSKLKMHVQQGDKRTEAGIYIDSFTTAVRNGQKVFARYAFLPARQLFDTAYYDMNTLQSLLNSEHSSAGTWLLNYSSTKITGSYYNKSKDSTTRIEQSMENAFFDGYLNDFLPRFLRLKENYVAKIPLYSFGQKGVTWITVRVTGSEKMNAPDALRTDVWVVEISWPGNPVKLNLYVAKQTRAVLKMHMQGEKFSMVKEAI